MKTCWSAQSTAGWCHNKQLFHTVLQQSTADVYSRWMNNSYKQSLGEDFIHCLQEAEVLKCYGILKMISASFIILSKLNEFIIF